MQNSRETYAVAMRIVAMRIVAMLPKQASSCISATRNENAQKSTAGDGQSGGTYVAVGIVAVGTVAVGIVRGRRRSATTACLGAVLRHPRLVLGHNAKTFVIEALFRFIFARAVVWLWAIATASCGAGGRLAVAIVIAACPTAAHTALAHAIGAARLCTRIPGCACSSNWAFGSATCNVCVKGEHYTSPMRLFPLQEVTHFVQEPLFASMC